MAGQKVVVIHDASRDVSWSAVRWVLKGFLLKPGDELTLLGVLHQVNNPSTFSIIRHGEKLGYKSKVDFSSLFGANPRVVEEEISRKMEEYRQNADLKQLSKQCEAEKIKFDILVHAGSSPKLVALEAALKLMATWVILDRQMKKDKKYFMKNLFCGISRMKGDNTIEQLRGPTEIVEKKLITSGRNSQFSYGEMIPGNRKKQLSPKKGSSNQNNNSSKGERNFVGGSQHNHRTSFSSSFSEQISLVSCSSFTNTEASTSMETKSSDSMYFEEEKCPPCVLKREKVTIEAMDTICPSLDEDFENSVCSVCKNKRPNVGHEKDFTYAELYKATNGFSPENFLSEGGFGSVYKGFLDNGLTVAVKQHKDVSFQGEKEFKSEVSVLSRARHPNLVRLLGSCSEGSHRLLVYEFVCNGSLDQHLSKNAASPLDWGKKIKVALEAAKGLEYLHRNNIIHRDMRPNNILVTHDHDSMLGDFGLARTQNDDPDHSTETGVVGTLGYVAPEYAEYGKLSTKTDVYSFGVVLLQLITGLRTREDKFEGKSLVGWAKPLLKEKNYPGLIDDRLVEIHDFTQLLWMVRVAEECLHKEPSYRYSMAKVVEALESIIQNTACISPAKSPSMSPNIDDDACEVNPEVNSYTEEVLLTTREREDAHENKPKVNSYTEEVPLTTKGREDACQYKPKVNSYTKEAPLTTRGREDASDNKPKANSYTKEVPLTTREHENAHERKPRVNSSAEKLPLATRGRDDADESKPEVNSYTEEVALSRRGKEDASEIKPKVNWYNNEEVPLTTRGSSSSLNQLMNADKLSFLQSPTTEIIPARKSSASVKSAKDVGKSHDRKRGHSQSGSHILYSEMIN